MGKWGGRWDELASPHGLPLGKDGGPPGLLPGCRLHTRPGVLRECLDGASGFFLDLLRGEGPRVKLSLTQGRWRQALCGDTEAQGSNLWALQP